MPKNETIPTREPPKPKKQHPTLDSAIGAAQWSIANRLKIDQNQVVYVGQWKYEDASGMPVAWVIRHNLPQLPGDAKPPKQFTPIHAEGMGFVLGDPKGKWPLYRLPTIGRAKRLFFSEGEKAADAIASLAIPSTTTAHGAKSPQNTDFTPLGNVDELVILPDNDDAGRDYAKIVANIALAAAPLLKVKILELPGLPPKGDGVEFLAARTHLEPEEILAELDALVAKTPLLILAKTDTPAPAVKDPRPKIMLTTDHAVVIQEVLPILGTDPNVFSREGSLARLVRVGGKADHIRRSDGSIVIAELPESNLCERLTSLIRFYKKTSAGDEIRCDPKPWLLSELIDRKEYPGIRRLRGISDAPVLRADGSIWQTPGYDEQTQVVYHPSLTVPPIPATITPADAGAAVKRLAEVVCDFRFEAPEHYAAYIAALLTPLARFAYEGPSPLFLVDANVRGAGKSLLVQTVGHIVQGRDIPSCIYSHEPVEMRKVITTTAIAGDRMVLLDNLSDNFGNTSLDSALTSTQWKDRKLGSNDTVDLPLVTVWYATGNNVSVAADTARRIIHVRLEVLEEKPEERGGFKHAHLLGWIDENRARLLSDALLILSGYLQSKAEITHKAAFGSFEGWSGVVRSACVWAGLPDPCLTRAYLAEHSDNSADRLVQLLAAWEAYAPECYQRGMMIPQLLASLYPSSKREEWPQGAGEVELRAALENLADSKPGQPPTSRIISNRLKRYRHRICRGRFLDTVGEKTNSGIAWMMYRVDGTVPAVPEAAPLFAETVAVGGDSEEGLL